MGVTDIVSVREHCPDVEAKIVRLESIARDCGKYCVWGQKPEGRIEVAETGPLCSSCDRRATAGGFVTLVAEGRRTTNGEGAHDRTDR
jgi:hypothetical protein